MAYITRYQFIIIITKYPCKCYMCQTCHYLILRHPVYTYFVSTDLSICRILFHKYWNKIVMFWCFFLFFCHSYSTDITCRTRVITSHTFIVRDLRVVLFRSLVNPRLILFFRLNSIVSSFPSRVRPLAVHTRRDDVCRLTFMKHDDLLDIFSRFRSPGSHTLVLSVAHRSSNLFTRFCFHVITYYNRIAAPSPSIRQN